VTSSAASRRGEACGVLRPAAAAESSARGRDNAVGLTSILNKGNIAVNQWRRSVLSLSYPWIMTKKNARITARIVTVCQSVSRSRSHFSTLIVGLSFDLRLSLSWQPAFVCKHLDQTDAISYL